MHTKQEVVAYYDYTIPFYTLFWHRGTKALHYGIWDEKTQNLEESLVNTNRVVAETAGIKDGDNVLDAGCGVGGTSLWIAKNTGANVTGITLSPKQCAKAEQYAKQLGVEEKTRFLVRDFLTTGFPNESFDVVIAIESACYALDKADFIREAYRVLKPGGRLAVADGFLKKAVTDETRTVYEDFLKGFMLDNLANIDSFTEAMRETGFVDTVVYDKTSAAQKTIDAMHALTTRWYWLNKLLSDLGVVPSFMKDNARTGIVQKELFEEIAMYGVVRGRKDG